MKQILFCTFLIGTITLLACQNDPVNRAHTDTQTLAPPAPQQTIVPQPIPAGFDFPGNRAELQKLADTNNIAAMRKHSWNLWAGLTANSTSLFEGKALPIWETWLATEQVFTKPATETTTGAVNAGIKQPAREFKDPGQFSHIKNMVKSKNQMASGLVGFNKYDPTMVQYLWAGHMQAGLSNELVFFYTSSSSLTALNGNWGTTPIKDRKIVDAPNTALELKPVLMTVKAQGLTALPFWKDPRSSTDKNCAAVSIEKLRHPKPGQPATDCHPDPTTWTHCVLIDPNAHTDSLQPATKAQFANADKSETPGCTDPANTQYGGINMLYHFKMTAAEAAAFNTAQQPAIAAKPGDFMVLMAMHVNTKEIVDWTWQTFWWQGGQETPDQYPGSGHDRTANIKAPWTNYNMCSAYAQTTKPDNQGDMNVCFNPYLETSSGIPDGLRSNCVTCHGTATIGTPKTGGYPATYDRPVGFGDPAYFGGATKTDFSWAIPVNAQ